MQFFYSRTKAQLSQGGGHDKVCTKRRSRRGEGGKRNQRNEFLGQENNTVQ